MRHVASNNYEWTKAEERANLVVGTEVARLASGNWDSQMLLSARLGECDSVPCAKPARGTLPQLLLLSGRVDSNYQLEWHTRG